MLVAFSVAPGGVSGSLGEIVADALEVVERSGLPHRTDAMFTTIEGEWDECMDVIRQCCQAVAKHGDRVSLVLKADIRPGHTGQLDHKVQRVEAILAERGYGYRAPAPGVRT